MKRGSLGPPTVRLAALQLWVHGRQFPDSHDPWDGNWLSVTANCDGQGGSVWVSGSILDTVSILRFRDALDSIYRVLHGTAVLSSHEPNLVVRVEVCDSIGHLRTRVEITPDHMAEGHWFEFEIDQTYLPPLIEQLTALLEAFPVRDPARRGR